MLVMNQSEDYRETQEDRYMKNRSCLTIWDDQSFNETVNQSINQPINQSVNQSIYELWIKWNCEVDTD